MLFFRTYGTNGMNEWNLSLYIYVVHIIHDEVKVVKIQVNIFEHVKNIIHSRT